MRKKPTGLLLLVYLGDLNFLIPIQWGITHEVITLVVEAVLGFDVGCVREPVMVVLSFRGRIPRARV